MRTLSDSACSSEVGSNARQRRMTESSDDSGIGAGGNGARDMASFQELLQNKAKPSNIGAIMEEEDALPDDSVLGNVSKEFDI